MAGILMIAGLALEKRTAELQRKEAQIAALAARVEALELRQNQPIQITAEEWVTEVGQRTKKCSNTGVES